MSKHTLRKIFWITIFSLAMGFLESAVVIYLRELYYPNGFAFPLKMMSPTTILTELLREFATLVMLVSVGIIVGRTKTEKFGYFIYSFAIWDLFYYVFLKLLIRWPEALMTWDVLFLLPTTWVGPVIAPLLLSIAMIVLGLAISYFTDKNIQATITFKEWFFLITGSFIAILSFTFEYSQYMLQQFSIKEMMFPDENILNYAIQFIPFHFPWLIFCLGYITILLGIGCFTQRNYKMNKIL